MLLVLVFFGETFRPLLGSVSPWRSSEAKAGHAKKAYAARRGTPKWDPQTKGGRSLATRNGVWWILMNFGAARSLDLPFFFSEIQQIQQQGFVCQVQRDDLHGGLTGGLTGVVKVRLYLSSSEFIYIYICIIYIYIHYIYIQYII